MAVIKMAGHHSTNEFYDVVYCYSGSKRYLTYIDSIMSVSPEAQSEYIVAMTFGEYKEALDWALIIQDPDKRTRALLPLISFETFKPRVVEQIVSDAAVLRQPVDRLASYALAFRENVCREVTNDAADGLTNLLNAFPTIDDWDAWKAVCHLADIGGAAPSKDLRTRAHRRLKLLAEQVETFAPYFAKMVKAAYPELFPIVSPDRPDFELKVSGNKYET